MPRPKHELSPAQRILRSRIAGKKCASLHSPDDMLAAARTALASKWEREVDPDCTLEPAERERRANAARASFFAALSLKGQMARKARKES
jgi:hypothetical protein